MLRLPRMTVTGRIQLGFAWTAVMVLMLVTTVVAQALWLQSWRDDYGKSVANTDTAASIQAKLLDTTVYGLDVGRFATANRADLVFAKQTARDNFEDITFLLSTLEAGATEETASEVQHATELALEYQQGFEQALTVAATDAAAAQAKLNALRPTVVELEETLATIVLQEKAVADDLLESHGSVTHIVMMVSIILAFLAAAAGVGGAWVISRVVSRELRGAFTRLSASASELLAVSTQVAGSAAQTAASTSEATVTVEEVKQTAILASEKADEVGRESQDLPGVAEAGRTAAEQTAAAFESTRDQMLSMVETISQLSDRTQAVEEIITTVNDLAEQSNLLSVNASIEAAKAGDYGKGFGVVAQEVKSLAQQSKVAVVQARGVLAEIVKAGEVAIQSASAGQESVDAGIRQSAESGKSIYALAESASRSAESAVQISVSSRQQLTGMEQIAQVIDDINKAGAQSAAGTRQVQQEVTRLERLAVELRGLVDKDSWTLEAERAASDGDTDAGA